MKNEFTLAKAIAVSGMFKIALGIGLLLLSLVVNCFVICLIALACISLGALMTLGGMLADL